IEDERDPSAKGPALREGVWKPGYPEAADHGHDGQVDVPDLMRRRSSDDALGTLLGRPIRPRFGGCAWIAGRRVKREASLDGARGQPEPRASEHLRDAH